MEDEARHVFVGHAFVTPHGESEDNTSDSERPIAIGGAEYVSAHLFEPIPLHGARPFASSTLCVE